MTSVVLGGAIVFDNLYADPAAGLNFSMPAVFDTWNALPNVSGTLTSTQPVSEIPAAKGGVLTPGINNFFLYDRIQVDPSLLDLGNLISVQTRLVSVWNGFGSNQTVEFFGGLNTEGIDVTEPNSTPYDLIPYQQVYYEFQISLEGPSSVDATYTLTVEGVDYFISVIGSRVVLWPFPPNWASPVNESLEWRTDILTSHNGNEQRMALRSVARRRIEYLFSAKRTDAQRLDNILWGWQNHTFAIPMWQYKCKLSGAVAPGALVLSLPTVNAGFIPGQTAVLFRDGDYYEVVEIQSVTSNSITPSRPLELDWPVGTAVYPLMIGNFESNVPLTRATDNLQTGNAMFLGDPGQTDPYVPVVAATNTYNGREIILRQPDWANGVDNSSDFPSDLVDFGTGALQRSVTRDTVQLGKQYTWNLRTRAEVEDFREFLGRHKGRNKAFYVPTWHDDFTLVQTVAPAAVSLLAKDVQYFNLVGADPARAHLLIRMRTGQYFLRPIMNVGKTGNDLSINFGTALGVELNIANCKMISAVLLYRFASDKVTFQWLTNGKAVVSALLTSVKS